MTNFEDGYFDAGEVRLHYVAAGSAPLVILYHGFPRFRFSFHHQMTALKDEFRVVSSPGSRIHRCWKTRARSTKYFVNF